MPTKKELYEKINELEEENKKLNTALSQGADMCNDLIGFIKLVKLWNVFIKVMDKGELVIDEVKEAVNNICPKCRENNCESCNN
tara:strand:- start:459 stop:710 length:252 start_codon:yes stop_codon:yes gene_type:complete